MTTDQTPHRAVLTVTAISRPDGGHYFDQADFTGHITEWVRAALRGKHAVDDVTIVDQAAELARALAEAHQYRTALQGVARAAAVSVPPPTGTGRRGQLLDALDFAYCQGLGYHSPEALLDAYDAERAVSVPPPADQTSLRDRIAEALYAHDHLGWRVSLRESDVEPVYRERAAAVLAVLPAPADGPSRVAAEEQPAETHSCRNCEGIDPDTCLMNPDRPKRPPMDPVHILGIDAAPERPAVGEQPAPCAECGHPRTVHREGDDPVTPGECSACPDDDARHDYRPAVGEQPAERPRCPHCQLPHDLTPDSLPAAVCASTRQRIADATQAHTVGDHSGCCRVDCDALQAVGEQPETQETPVLPCNYWTHTGTEHTPHRWVPQPGMDPVHCPGYDKSPE